MFDGNDGSHYDVGAAPPTCVIESGSPNSYMYSSHSCIYDGNDGDSRYNVGARPTCLCDWVALPMLIQVHEIVTATCIALICII